MAKLTVHTIDGSGVSIADSPDEAVAALIDAFMGDPEDVHAFGFNLDNGAGMSYIPRSAIARIDVDWDTKPETD